jgi:hypothetical protein
MIEQDAVFGSLLAFRCNQCEVRLELRTAHGVGAGGMIGPRSLRTLHGAQASWIWLAVLPDSSFDSLAAYVFKPTCTPNPTPRPCFAVCVLY